MSILTKRKARTLDYRRRELLEQHTTRAENVVVLYNVADSESIQIKDEYVSARSIPAENVIGCTLTGWASSSESISEAGFWAFADSVYPQIQANPNIITTLLLCGRFPAKVAGFTAAGTTGFTHVLTMLGFVHDYYRDDPIKFKFPDTTWNVGAGNVFLYTGIESDLYPKWSLDDPAIFSLFGNNQSSYDTRIPFLVPYKKQRLMFSVFVLDGGFDLAQAVINKSLAAEVAYSDYGRVLISGAELGNSDTYNDDFLDEASRWGIQDSGFNWTNLDLRTYNPDQPADVYANRGEFYNPALYYLTSANESIPGMCDTTGASTWASCTEEEWSSPQLFGAGWVNNGDGSFTHSGTVTGDVRVYPAGLDADIWYTVKVTISGGSVDTVRLGGGTSSGNDVATNVTVGTHILRLKGDTKAGYDAIRFMSDNEGVTISDISVYPENTEIGLRLVGEYSYYGKNSPCESVGDYRYRDGAICIFSQSTPATGEFYFSPTWEDSVPVLIDVTDQDAYKDNMSLGSYKTQYSQINCTVNGYTRKVMAAVYDGAGTTATVSIASNIITLKVDGGVVHTIDATSKTFKDIYDDLQTFIAGAGAGWEVWTWSQAGTPNRVECAIRAGATAAIGCNYEPMDKADVDAKGLPTLLYSGGCLADWVLTRLSYINNWFCYGDPLLRPIEGSHVTVPKLISNLFVVPATPDIPEADMSLSNLQHNGVYAYFDSDFLTDGKNKLLFDVSVNSGEWQTLPASTTSPIISRPYFGGVAGDTMRYRVRKKNPYGVSEGIGFGTPVVVPAVLSGVQDMPGVSISDLQSTSITLGWDTPLPDTLTWFSWVFYLDAFFLPFPIPLGTIFSSNGNAQNTITIPGLGSGIEYSLSASLKTRNPDGLGGVIETPLTFLFNFETPT